MAESYDLPKMLEEIIDDEKVTTSRNKKISQDEIKRLLRERKRPASAPKESSRLPLGEALIRDGLISAEQLQTALKMQSKKGGKIGSLLIELGYIGEENLLKFLGDQHGIQSASLLHSEISEKLISMLPSKLILKNRVLPLKAEGNTLSLAMENPTDFATIHEIEFLTGRRVTPVIIPSYQMDIAIKFIEEKGGVYFSGSEIQQAMKAPTTVQSLLEQLVSTKGSDLLITAGVPPALKIDGILRRSNTPALSADQCVGYAKSLMSERQWEDFLRKKELDFAVDQEDVGRFRVNAYRQKNTVSLAVRRINEVPYTFEQLGLPPWLADFTVKPQGLILITAPTGHGKTTTVASMIDLINKKRKCNIITLEDPIEYVHRSVNSVVNQREVGTDTDSFSEGLRRIFRQAPDVIVIGELRDQESFEIAIGAASTGHLVLSTMHSSNTTAAIDSMVNRFPHHLQSQVRQQLADALLIIFTQRLIPNREGGGLVLAYEKLINSYRIKNFIRENKLHQVRSQIQTESDDFASIDVSLIRLVREGKISMQNALTFADSPDLLIKMTRSGSSEASIERR